jgi:3-oxoacyl-[acyl-carrier protein] reductase
VRRAYIHGETNGGAAAPREEGVSLEDYAARVQQAIPLGRYGEPEEIGSVVAFLCSERASYVTGVSLQVDGGVIQSTF